MKEEKWVKVKEYIKHYNLSKSLAYQHIHAKNFPCKKVGKNAYRINLIEADKWLDKNFNLRR